MASCHPYKLDTQILWQKRHPLNRKKIDFLQVFSTGLFLSHCCLFSYNGVYKDTFKLSVNDVIVSQKGSNGNEIRISLGGIIILLAPFAQNLIFGLIISKLNLKSNFKLFNVQNRICSIRIRHLNNLSTKIFKLN